MRRLVAGFALLALGLTGCGSSSLLSPAAAPEAAAATAARNVRGNFFPLNAGRFLGFAPSETAFAQPEVVYSIEVNGAAPRLGQGVMEVVDPETRSFVRSDRRGVFLVASAELPDGGVRRLPRPMRLITYPLRVGRVWTDRYGRGPQSLHVRHWVADLVTVRTPQGVYRAFQIERRVWRGNARPDFSADGLGRWTHWYAPNIGPVQIGTRWPGVTYETYQLCATERPAAPAPEPFVLLQGVPDPTAGGAAARGDAGAGNPWRGLAAGLEPLLRD